MENVRWLSFHSGYDFGYLLKILTNQNLPTEESEFFELLRLYFPNVYDVKYLMKSCKSLKGGLQEVADMLEVERIGPQHQAGSDSLLTGLTFFKMTEMFFEDAIDDTKYLGHLYGLGTSYVVSASTTDKGGCHILVFFYYFIFQEAMLSVSLLLHLIIQTLLAVDEEIT